MQQCLAILTAKKAAVYNKPEIIEYLLKKSHDHSAMVKNILMTAAWCQHFESIIETIRQCHQSHNIDRIIERILSRNTHRRTRAGASLIARDLDLEQPTELPILVRPTPLRPCRFKCAGIFTNGGACGQSFETKEEWEAHCKKQPHKKNPKCLVMRFDPAAYYVPCGKKFCCSSCGQENLNSANIITHIKKDHLGRIFPCPICEKIYTTKDKLKKHITSKHEVKSP